MSPVVHGMAGGRLAVDGVIGPRSFGPGNMDCAGTVAMVPARIFFWGGRLLGISLVFAFERVSSQRKILGGRGGIFVGGQALHYFTRRDPGLFSGLSLVR